MSTPILSSDEYFDIVRQGRKPYHSEYLAMYSSQWEGIVTDPTLWTVPVDDHVVHRGDAVFEVFKCVGGHAYCLTDHLVKLKNTVEKVGIKMPPAFTHIKDILRDVLRAGGEKDALVRVTVTRGPGGFTSNPYESPVGLLLVTVLRPTLYSEEKYNEGVKVITAPFMAKDPSIATMKVCSYIQNVLVKRAALDAGVDYAVCFGRDGFMTESSTENVAIVTQEGELLAPEWNVILKGTTLTRVMVLAEKMVGEGQLLTKVRHQSITLAQVLNAAEVFVCSTSIDVLPITTWDGQAIGATQGGGAVVAKELRRRLRAEYLAPGSSLLTDLWS